MKLFYNQKTILRIFVFAAVVFFMSCKSVYQTQAFTEAKVPAAPDYSSASSWAVLPDCYSEALQAFSPAADVALKADVFYVYPTMITNPKDVRWNAPIDDMEQQERVVGTAVLLQASAWANSGKLYVPFYRQAHIRSYLQLNQGGKEAFEVAYEDVKNAFSYYLNTYNKGRPIIIASHSQGTTHSIRLLQEFFDGTPLQKQLVAAYIPGMRVAPNTFKTIVPMTRPDQIGGFVSWNTHKRNTYPKKDRQWYKGSVTSNPITWDEQRQTTHQQHKGFLYSNKKLYRQALKIALTDGLVWTSLPRFPLRIFALFKKNYHAGDVNLFWQDIRENAALRVQEWLKQQAK